MKNITPSDTLTNPTTLVQIALAMKDTGLGNIVFLQYPAISDPSDPNRVIVDDNAAQAIDDALVKDVPVKLTGTTGRAAEEPNASATPTPTPTETAPASPSTPAATPRPRTPTRPGGASEHDHGSDRGAADLHEGQRLTSARS